MTDSSFHPSQRTLMGPGPSDVPPRILEALSRPTLGHLDPEFVGLMDETKKLLQYVFMTESELTMPISAPGSAGMEAAFVNLVEPGDKVISSSPPLRASVGIVPPTVDLLAVHGAALPNLVLDADPRRPVIEAEQLG